MLNCSEELMMQFRLDLSKKLERVKGSCTKLSNKRRTCCQRGACVSLRDYF